MNYKISMSEICGILNLKERTAFRRIERAYENLAEALNKSKYCDKLYGCYRNNSLGQIYAGLSISNHLNASCHFYLHGDNEIQQGQRGFMHDYHVCFIHHIVALYYCTHYSTHSVYI